MTKALGYTDLTFGHLSTLVFQGRQKQYDDLDKLLSLGYDVVTVTEIGSDRKAWRTLARKHGYRAYAVAGSDGGVAIRASLIESGWRYGIVRAIKQTGRQMGSTRPFGPKGIVWGGAYLTNIGSTDIGTVHLLTGGRVPGRRSQHGRVNHYNINRKYTRTIGKWADRRGKGKRLVFVTGDANIVDRVQDVFLGQARMTTCWDELGVWPNTGHGNIDFIASYDADARVRCIQARAFTDKQIRFGSDHFLIEATYRIRNLKSAR